MKQTFLQFIFISLLSLPLSVTVLSAQCDVGTVSGKLWTETNINMIQDQNEPSLRNITLRLYPDYNNNTFIDSNEPLLDAVTTDTIGKYSFTNVSPGTYLIDLDGINTDLHAMSRINPGSANYSFVLENNDCINDLNIAFAESGCNNSVSNLCTFFASIGDRIYSINSQTGATFLLTDISEDAPEGFPLPTAVNAMGSDPVTGWVYYISSGQSENNYRLYGWNIYTNTHKVISNDLTEYGIVPFGTNIGSAAYFYNGSLYIGVGTFPSRVWRIDFNSSSNGETIRSASLITTTSSWRWRDLVIIDGTMYMSYYKGGVRLERFDLIGGGALVDMTTDPLSNVQQLATCGNGELLSVGDSIQVINTTSGNFSGTATPILGFSGSSFDAAGCIPAHASIGDLVWIDSNANNTYDDGEQPIPYVIVSLYEDTNGDNLFDSRDRFLGTRTTDINGNYLFENLPLGRYWVVLSPTNNPFISNGAVATTPSGNQQYHQLGVTEHRTIADFGFNAATLPVELIYFRGVKYGECSINLEWATASESNNAKFVVQRSLDGVHFHNLGVVDGHGTTTTTQTYSFVDKDPTRLNYYRLLQVDYNGNIEYSGVINIQGICFENSNVISSEVIPNPVVDEMAVRVITDLPVSGTFSFINSFGQVVKETHYERASGVELVKFNVSDLPNGLYFLHFQRDGNRHSQILKFVKIDEN